MPWSPWGGDRSYRDIRGDVPSLLVAVQGRRPVRWPEPAVVPPEVLGKQRWRHLGETACAEWRHGPAKRCEWCCSSVTVGDEPGEGARPTSSMHTTQCTSV